MEILFALIAIAFCVFMDNEYATKSQLRFAKKHGSTPSKPYYADPENIEVPTPKYLKE